MDQKNEILEQNVKTYKLTDENGTEIETVLKENVETLEEKIEELKEQNKNTQEELLKLTNKDYNYSALKKKAKRNEYEIEEKEKKLKEKEIEIEEKEKTFIEKQVIENKTNASITFSGNDEKLREKMLHYYDNELTGEALTKGEIEEKMKKAYILASEEQIINPISMAMNKNGGSTTMGSIGSSETEYSSFSRRRLNITDEDKKKYNENWNPSM